MKIAVCIAAHERMKPLAIVLGQLPAHWHAVVVLSPGENSSALLKRPNTHVFHHANLPLGWKWQHAVNHARDLKPDAIVIAGSDDVLLVDEAKLLPVLQEYDMVGPRSFLAYDGAETWHCAYKEHVPMPIGSGRIYTRQLLDRLRWRLFDTGRNNLLDDFGYRTAVRHGARLLQANDIPGLRVIALKGDWPCKNPMDKYFKGKNLSITQAHVRDRVHYQL